MEAPETDTQAPAKGIDKPEAPKPTPAATPVVPKPKPGSKENPAPAPDAPACVEGATRGWTDNSQQRGPGWTPGVETCRNGEWVRTSDPVPPAETGPSAP